MPLAIALFTPLPDDIKYFSHHVAICRWYFSPMLYVAIGIRAIVTRRWARLMFCRFSCLLFFFGTDAILRYFFIILLHLLIAATVHCHVLLFAFIATLLAARHTATRLARRLDTYERLSLRFHWGFAIGIAQGLFTMLRLHTRCFRWLYKMMPYVTPSYFDVFNIEETGWFCRCFVISGRLSDACHFTLRRCYRAFSPLMSYFCRHAPDAGFAAAMFADACRCFRR